MTERNPRNVEIVRQLETDANAAAVAYLADVDDFARQTRLQCMIDLLDEFIEWMDERGDADNLEDHGVAISEDVGVVLLSLGERSLTMRARDDMSIAFGAHIVQPNRDCPVLDEALYAELMSRIDAWVACDERKGPLRYFE
ncbi:MAG: hypothetical protein K0U74_04825 [Alphaproteobacteria bacterium]|nr:hypothetical protein [Alphaproteobacteria bacterium]